MIRPLGAPKDVQVERPATASGDTVGVREGSKASDLALPAQPKNCSVAPHRACVHCGYCHEHEADMAPDDWRCDEPDPQPCEYCGGSGRVVAGELCGAPVYADCSCEAGGFLPFEWDAVTQEVRR